MPVAYEMIVDINGYFIKGSKGNRACATMLGKLPKLIVLPQ